MPRRQTITQDDGNTPFPPVPQQGLERTNTFRELVSRATRPRLNTLQSPESTPWKIASTYNLHNEPVYQQIVPDSEVELQEIGFPREKQQLNELDSGQWPEEIPPRARKQSIKELFTEPDLDLERVATLRRKSTVRSSKAKNIISWKGPDDPVSRDCLTSEAAHPLLTSITRSIPRIGQAAGSG